MNTIRDIMQWFMWWFGYRYIIMTEEDNMYLLVKYNKRKEHVHIIKYWSDVTADKLKGKLK